MKKALLRRMSRKRMTSELDRLIENRALFLSIHFHDGWYYGAGDWPPAPARLFQALVAGVARGGNLTDDDKIALEWLETLKAPVIATPAVRMGQAFRNYVPDNDLDAVGYDLQLIGKIRTYKNIQPHIFDSHIPLLFVWTFNGGGRAEGNAQSVCRIAEQLYQLGRGVDMAWACAEILNADSIEGYLARHRCVVYRPSRNGTGKGLLIPQKGSLASLEKRFKANRSRLTSVKKGRKDQTLFSLPPKPIFTKVGYDAPPRRFLFEIRTVTHDESFVALPCTQAPTLVMALRDKAVSRLHEALTEDAGKVDRVFIGREAKEADKAARVRIVPLPSIGHSHADCAIRRILIEVPPNCPLRADDIEWAFSGLENIDPATGEIVWNLIHAKEQGMLDHYGIGVGEQNSFRVWRTVTPVALPVMRIGHRTSGGKRLESQTKTIPTVIQTLRHAGVTVPVESVQIQQEPFDSNGIRAGEFAMPERFVARGLHHMEIVFAKPLCGPLVIGNGRYLGLGLMAPRKSASNDVLIFSIASETGIAIADTKLLLHAVRRALMALARDNNGDVPRLFSGHEREGSPARSGGHEHVFLAADDTNGDGRIDRLVVAAPWVCDRTTKGSREDSMRFDRVTATLTNVRAGRLGVLTLGPASALAFGDPLLGPACMWTSRTSYRPTRHAGRGKDIGVAIVLDVIAECQRRGFPKPKVELLELNVGPNGGASARISLRFALAVEGPIMLGRDSHRGGGLFAISDISEQ